MSWMTMLNSAAFHCSGELFNALRHGTVGGRQLTKFDEGSNDHNTHLYGTIAPEHG